MAGGPRDRIVETGVPSRSSMEGWGAVELASRVSLSPMIGLVVYFEISVWRRIPEEAAPDRGGSGAFMPVEGVCAVVVPLCISDNADDAVVVVSVLVVTVSPKERSLVKSSDIME